MAREIPNHIVDLIVANAIQRAHYQQAARLSLVNKSAYSAYKQCTNVSRNMIKDIVIQNAVSSDSFKMSMKVMQGTKIAYELSVANKLLSIKDRLTGTHVMFSSLSPNVFFSTLEKMVSTPRMREIRVQTRCKTRDNDTIMPIVTRFVKYMNAKCVKV